MKHVNAEYLLTSQFEFSNSNVWLNAVTRVAARRAKSTKITGNRAMINMKFETNDKSERQKRATD